MSGRRTRRDVGTCRVRLASLTDGAIFQLFLPNEEQFVSLQVWKSLLLRACRENCWRGRLRENGCRLGSVAGEGLPRIFKTRQSSKHLAVSRQARSVISRVLDSGRALTLESAYA